MKRGLTELHHQIQLSFGNYFLLYLQIIDNFGCIITIYKRNVSVNQIFLNLVTASKIVQCVVHKITSCDFVESLFKLSPSFDFILSPFKSCTFLYPSRFESMLFVL